jgi:DNA replication and repair protein RecF
MILKSIQLDNFRSFQSKTIEFNKDLTILLGDNAVGKTNVLESIYFICTGKGLKDDKQEELLRFDEDEASVKAFFDDNSIEQSFKIVLKKENTIKKAYFVERSKKLLQHYTTYTPPVAVFSPERMDIIDGANSQRRVYFDHILSKIDIQYKKSLINYESAIRKRNKILEKASSPDNLQEDLQFWDEYLMKQAEYLYSKRDWYVSEINKQQSLDEHSFELVYEKNIISAERLEEYFLRQFYLKRTVIGPHRDTFTVFKNKNKRKIDVQKYSSRGEQRLALLWLLLHEIDIYSSQLERKPLVLLDDIFSELDQVNKKVIMEVIKNYQTIITSTEQELAQWPQNKAHTVQMS